MLIILHHKKTTSDEICTLLTQSLVVGYENNSRLSVCPGNFQASDHPVVARKLLYVALKQFSLKFNQEKLSLDTGLWRFIIKPAQEECESMLTDSA